ncbi:MAG: S49 family peptidase [Gemmataceae bacterium]
MTAKHYLYSHVWAVDLNTLGWLERELYGKLGHAIAPPDTRVDQGPQAGSYGNDYQLAGRVAVIPIQGMIMQKDDWYFCCSTERLGQALDQAIADPAVDCIVLDCYSPGGSVYGVPELAAKIAACPKRVVAVANPLSASAAYWICSAADEFVLTPSGHVGSIGVYWLHSDLSRMFNDVGVTNTLVFAGKYKVEGNPYQPLGDEAKAALQADVDHVYTMFVQAVAVNRNTTPEKVQSGYGEGRIVNSSQAVELGLVDRIATFEEVLAGEINRGGDFNAMAAARQRQAEAFKPNG